MSTVIFSIKLKKNAMKEMQEKLYGKFDFEKNLTFFVADIGGTNTNFGILVKKENRFYLAISLHADSQKIISFPNVVTKVLIHLENKYKLRFESACFAVAGNVINDKVKLTNANFEVDAKDLKAQTILKNIYLINDFQAVGFGIDAIDPDKIVCVRHGRSVANSRRLCFGAGTGLGKTLLYWQESKNDYFAIPSEGGHALFSAQLQEFKLLEFISKDKKNCTNVTWEDILSGRGISQIYKFISSLNKKNSIDLEIEKNNYNPKDIFNFRTKSQNCSLTFELYSRFYARCAYNFAIDFLPYSGIFIGGGIAAKNLDIFYSDAFNKEINKYCKSKFIEQIPIYVLSDYNISLYGAANALNELLE